MMSAQMAIYIILIGLAAGVLSGSMGVGGGVVMVPLLMWIGLSQHQAQGTSLAAMLPPVTLLAVLNYSRAGYLNWTYAILLSAAVIIGGYFGSKIAIQINQKLLKQIFGGFMFFISLRMIFGK